MATFREILTATDTELVRHFYRLKPPTSSDFIKKIDQAAAQLGMNHSQLVCALGFNHHARDLTDILSVIGFSSYKLLSYRRDELFSTDTYRELDIDNVIDIYSEHLADEATRRDLRNLAPGRLTNIEARISDHAGAALIVSYKMEVHAIYAGGIATAEFATTRIERPIGDLRARIGEVQMIVDNEVLPASNLFYSDYLLPSEKRYLLESGRIDPNMVANRLRNSEISEDERQMLEDFS